MACNEGPHHALADPDTCMEDTEVPAASSQPRVENQNIRPATAIQHVRPLTSTGYPSQSSLDPNSQFSESRHKTEFDFRLPRYEVNKYSSYEEMLNQMNSDDPFSGQEPTPKDHSNKDKAVKDCSPQNSKSNKKKHLEKKKGISKKRSKKKGFDESSGSLAVNKSAPGETARPLSAISTATYTVESKDSPTQMATKQPPEKYSTLDSPVKLTVGSEESHKIRMDSRERMGAQTHFNQRAVVDYVQKNLNQRQCKHYLPKPLPKESSVCQCGRPLNWHEREQNSLKHKQTNEEWSSDIHTQTVPTTGYGTIRFYGFGQEHLHNSPFVRVDDKSDMRDIWTLLCDYWLMPPPKLLISVTGGAKRFFLKNRLKAGFKRGLVKAATTTGAWIITGGTNAGVMEFVGEAVKEHMLTAAASDQKVMALGIATWGIIDNRDSLINEDGDGLFPAEYNIDDLSPKSVRGVSPLNYNHTHFILVDDGSEGKFGREIKFRAAFEQYISENMETGVAKNQSVHVPVVLLVLEGGENSLVTAAASVKEGTPVVVIQDSGRAADFIAYGYKLTKERSTDDKTVYPSNFESEMHKRAVSSMFDWVKHADKDDVQQKAKQCVVNIKLILEKRRLVTVFSFGEMDSSDEIDHAILKALLKANKSDVQSQLNLALAWNRCDIARQEIFTMENRTHWQGMNLYEAMFTALVQDRVDFVRLFLDNGVDTKRFLTIRRLRDLYDDVVNDKYAGPAADLLKHMMLDVQQGYSGICSKEELDDDLPNLLQIVGKIINYLSGDQQQTTYSGGRYIVTNEEPSDLNINMVEKYKKMKNKYTSSPSCDFHNPNRELFLWAVLLNRKELALLFWRNGKDYIGGALAASLILKNLSDEANREEEIDLSQLLQANSQMFEELAVGVLNKCYTRNKAMSHALLTRELSIWGDTTLLCMADTGDLMDFMGHSSCQTLLNNIWMGKLALYTSTWKIMVSLFCPFLVLPLIKFSTNDSSLTSQQDTSAAHSSASNKTQVNKVVPEKSSESFAFHSLRRDHKEKAAASKLYRVGFLGGENKKSSLGFIKAFYHYQTTPLVKFSYHTISFLIFLALFSYFLLTDLHPIDGSHSPSVVEYIVWGWAFSLLVEEFRQIGTMLPVSLRYKLAGYFSSSWNIFDMFVFVLLILSIVLRLTLSAAHFTWARTAYTVTLTMFFLRFLQTFFVEKNIGPKVIMIRRMLTDLMFFILILIVFIFAFGVASQSLRYPNSSPSWSILADVVYMPYWQMYGELFLEDIHDGPDQCSHNASVYQADASIDRCSENSWLVLVLLALYMILTNILLLNLLIAMFSYTFERVQENSEKVWRFYRYGLVYEYFDKPTLAPPLIIISLFVRACKYFFRQCKDKQRESNDFRHILSEEENSKLSAFEQASMENFLLHRNLINKELIDSKIDLTSEKIEQVISDLEHIKENVFPLSVTEKATDSDATMSLMPAEPVPPPVQPSPSDIVKSSSENKNSYEVSEDISIMQRRITGLQVGLEEQQQQLNEMVMLLQELVSHHISTPAPTPSHHVQQGAPLRPTVQTDPVMQPVDLANYTYSLRQPQIEIGEYKDDEA